MAHHIRYVRPRENGKFYYERRVPKAVLTRKAAFEQFFGGVELFRKSLRTRRQSEAMIAGAEVHKDFERRLKWALGDALAAAGDHSATRPLTPETLQKIRAEARESVVRPWAEQVILTQFGDEYAEELDRMRHQRELDAEQLRAVLDPVNSARANATYADRNLKLPRIAERASRAIQQERISAPAGSTAWAAVATAVREGILAGEREVDDLLAGKVSAIPAHRLAARRARAPTISQVVDDYVAQLRAPRTIREVEDARKSFVAAVGDLPLDELSRADFMRFCEIEGARTIGGKDPHSIHRPIAPETLKKKVGLLRAAINRAIKTDGFHGPNPAAGIDVKQFTKPVSRSVMPAKRPFDVHELQLLLQHPWFTGCLSAARTHEPGSHRLLGMHYWAPLLAMHTGCRAGELGGLRVSEIRLDHAQPHIVVQDNAYRTTKGTYRRKVPILDVLIDHGFPAFVQRVAEEGHDRLFPDWKPPSGKVDAGATAWSNASVIRSFNRTVVRQQLGSILTAGTRQEVTFHSFRGAFKTLLGRSEYNLPPNYIHEVVGHAKSELDKRYIGEIPIEDTYEAMRKCRYRGLQLPPAPLMADRS